MGRSIHTQITRSPAYKEVHCRALVAAVYKVSNKCRVVYHIQVDYKPPGDQL